MAQPPRRCLRSARPRLPPVPPGTPGAGSCRAARRRGQHLVAAGGRRRRIRDGVRRLGRGGWGGRGQGTAGGVDPDNAAGWCPPPPSLSSPHRGQTDLVLPPGSRPIAAKGFR